MAFSFRLNHLKIAHRAHLFTISHGARKEILHRHLSRKSPLLKSRGIDAIINTVNEDEYEKTAYWRLRF